MGRRREVLSRNGGQQCWDLGVDVNVAKMKGKGRRLLTLSSFFSLSLSFVLVFGGHELSSGDLSPQAIVLFIQILPAIL
jgi:hypothetical protein